MLRYAFSTENSRFQTVIKFVRIRISSRGKRHSTGTDEIFRISYVSMSWHQIAMIFSGDENEQLCDAITYARTLARLWYGERRRSLRRAHDVLININILCHNNGSNLPCGVEFGGDPCEVGCHNGRRKGGGYITIVIYSTFVFADDCRLR